MNLCLRPASCPYRLYPYDTLCTYGVKQLKLLGFSQRHLFWCSLMAKNRNFDRNPLRGCNYGLEGGAVLNLGGCSIIGTYSFNRVSHAAGRLFFVKSTRLRNSLQSTSSNVSTFFLFSMALAYFTASGE